MSSEWQFEYVMSDFVPKIESVVFVAQNKSVLEMVLENVKHKASIERAKR